jgi:predicted nucleic acid-binding protein
MAHLKVRVDKLLLVGQARLETISTDTQTYKLYYQLSSAPATGHAIIGKGEAASIALAKNYDGIVASNNLRDIRIYIKGFGLRHITTGAILREALERGYITEVQGNKIWTSMLAKRRKLGAASFTEYIQSE